MRQFQRHRQNPAHLIGPFSAEVARVEKQRTSTGTVHQLNLTAASAMVDLGAGNMPMTWAFSGQTPGKEIRISAGDTLAAELSNQLPNQTSTSIH